jgi:TonB-dependent starch-binding outer membrane protein SusC
MEQYQGSIKMVLSIILSFFSITNHVFCEGELPSYTVNQIQTEEPVIITGTIIDETDQALLGVNVNEKGTVNGTVTDGAGMYEIKVSGSDAILVFSFIGYVTQEIEVGEQTTIDLKMEPNVEALSEIVVVGYGTQKKATLSGSVAMVKGDEITKSPAMNVTNSLSTIAGLVAVGQSGEPGSDYSTLLIRGQSTLNNNSPLVVVDGVPNRSLERIDPSTIESVTVLKDASAAIYGSQAANGVILVTTKRGQNKKMTVTASYNVGWSRPTRIPQLTNSAEYATLVNEVDYYDNINPTYSSEDIQKYADGSNTWEYPNTDWYDVVLKNLSRQSSTNVTVSGGNDFLQTFISLSNRDQDGVYVNSASKYSQNDLRINNDCKINPYINVSLDASARLEQYKSPTSSAASIFRDLMTALPIKTAVWPNGLPGPPISTTDQNNPVVQATSEAGTNRTDNYVFNINSKINIKIPGIEGLSLTLTGALDRGLEYQKNFSKVYSLYTWDGTTYEDDLPSLKEGSYGTSDLVQQLEISKRYLVNSLVSYQRTYNEIHDINFLVGVEAIEETSNWFSAERRNFANNFPEELNFGNSNYQYANGSNPGVNRWQNYFGRANYTFKNKYIAEFVWRYQGSSKFASETRWGFFPGISLAYRISEENFWKNKISPNLINNLKLRFSFGKTGNDLIDPYQFYSLYSLNWRYFVTEDQTNYSTYYESLAGNTKAQWEEANQSNIGFDIAFFNNKLAITGDYFNNLRTKILIAQTASVPDMTGLSGILPDINLGKVRNQGFDFEIMWKEHVSDFKYHIGLNGCYAKNKVIFFDEAEGALDWQKQTGHPMESGLYYEAIGIFHNQDDLDNYPHLSEARTGDIIFNDVDGDGEITGNDMKRIYKNSIPTLTGSLSLYASYKGFDLTIMFQGQAGAVRYLQDLGGKNSQNYLKSFYDKRWTENNPDADYPRTFNRNDEYWVSSDNPNTFWLRKTDFIRLKNFELGYTVPSVFASKLKLEDVRIYVSGMNLLTYSPDLTDYDPELEPKGDGFAGQGYPLQKIITTGISIKF